MLPKHKMLIKNTRLICILTPCFWTPWKKKISFPLWFCWLQSDAVLKLIRTLWSDVMRGWPHGTLPPAPLPHPHDCNHSKPTHHYCRTLAHLIQTEGPIRLLLFVSYSSSLSCSAGPTGGGFSSPVDTKSRRSDSFFYFSLPCWSKHHCLRGSMKLLPMPQILPHSSSGHVHLPQPTSGAWLTKPDSTQKTRDSIRVTAQKSSMTVSKSSASVNCPLGSFRGYQFVQRCFAYMVQIFRSTTRSLHPKFFYELIWFVNCVAFSSHRAVSWH